MSILDALNRVGLSSRPASVIPAQQPVEGPRMPVQPFSQPAKISGPSESYQALGESEKAELLKAIGMDGQQVEQPKPEPATAAVGSTELTLDASEPEAGPNSGGEAVTESKADSGQVEEKPDPKPASSDPLKNARKKRKDSGSETVPNRDVGNAKSIDEIITSGSTSRVLRKYLDENGGSPEDYKVVEEMEARESEAREAMLRKSLGPNEDNPEYRKLLERMATDQAIAKEEWEKDVIAQTAMRVAMSKTVWTGNDQYLFEVKPGDWAKAGHKQLRKLYRESGMFSWVYRLEKDSEKQRS